ncbi:MAG: hypothetical protein M3520_04615 [Actinomycetota bacterium]|jgi:hypothetical protein|nr:hypothetical protein [Actinomycetota bacterium]
MEQMIVIAAGSTDRAAARRAHTLDTVLLRARDRAFGAGGFAVNGFAPTPTPATDVAFLAVRAMV